MKRTTACFLAAMTAFATATQAADIFVAPEGRGAMTGADWSNARKGTLDGYSGVRAAIVAAVAGGATEVNVYFAGGAYSITNQMSLSSISVPVKLSGGYLAETDGSLAKGETETTFTRTANNARHLYASALSALSVDGIVFRNGKVVGNTEGGAFYLSSSTTSISNCVFSGNTIAKASSSYYTGKGAAIYSAGGSLFVRKCSFSSNYSTGGWNAKWGGALCTLNTVLLIDGCTFTGNYVSSPQGGSIGGAVCVNGNRATIRNSSFENNYASNDSTSSTGYAAGGALAVRSATRFEMSDCQLTKNYVKVTNKTRTSGVTSGCYFDDFNASDGVMTAVVERCVFDSRSVPATGRTKSDILLNCGALFMTNCLVMGATGDLETMKDSVRAQREAFPSGNKSQLADLVSGKGVLVVSTCFMELVNCTIADGKDVGAEAVGSDSELTLKNCISWGHSVSGVVNAASVAYSCIQEPHEGAGNFVADPHWTGAPYYHLLTKRAGGAITDGWFGGTYNSLKTEKNSPCLDVGAPGSAGLDLEPHPNGRHVNLGAYGGTPWATKTLSPPPTTLSVL